MGKSEAADLAYWTKQPILLSSILRMLAVLIFGGAVIVLSGLAYFGTFRVFFSPQAPQIPLFQCPSVMPKIMRSENINQGNYCQVSLYNWARTEARGKLLEYGDEGTGFKCSVPRDEYTNDEFDKLELYASRNPIVCNVLAPCSQVQLCAKQDGPGGAVQQEPCPRGPEEAFLPRYDNPETRYIYIQLTPPGVENELYIYYPWNRYRQAHFSEYCDSSFSIPVGKVIALRGLVFSLVIISILWFFVDLFLTIMKRRQVGRIQARIDALDFDQVEDIHNQNIAELIWMNTQRPPPGPQPLSRTSSLAETPRSGMVSRVITPVLNQDMSSWGSFGVVPSSSFKVAVCSNPYKAFSSLSWWAKIDAFNENFHKIGRGRSRTIFLSIPLSLITAGFLISLAVLALSPGDLVNTHSVADVIFSSYSTIWRAKSTWIILPFLLLDELYEAGLFLVESVLVRWGTETVFAKFAINEETMNNDECFDNDSDISEKNVVSDRLIPEGIVAVFCIDQIRLENSDQFLSNINSIILAFGIEKVFVLQFSDSLSPLDDTPVFLQSKIALGVQYLYVPERDQRAAVYWFSKYYIPLVQVHQDPNVASFPITHVMVIDQSISIPPTFVVPEQYINPTAEDDDGGEVHPLPGIICFASRNINSLDNIGTQFEIMHASFLSDRSTLGDSELAQRSGLILWERECLEKCAFTYEPMTVGLGGDAVGMGGEAMHIGRPIKLVHNNLIERRDLKSSVTSFRGFVDKLFLVHGRRKRLVFSDVKALISPSAVLNRMRLAEKPFAFHYFLRAIFDTIRLPVLIASGLRDPLGLAAILGLFIAILYVKLIVLWIVIERSPAAAKKDRPNFFSALIYPIYHVLWELILMRPLSVFAGLFWSLHDNPDTSLAIREDYEQNVPPCLPYPDAPWYSIWIAVTV